MFGFFRGPHAGLCLRFLEWQESSGRGCWWQLELCVPPALLSDLGSRVLLALAHFISLKLSFRQIVFVTPSFHLAAPWRAGRGESRACFKWGTFKTSGWFLFRNVSRLLHELFCFLGSLHTGSLWVFSVTAAPKKYPGSLFFCCVFMVWWFWCPCCLLWCQLWAVLQQSENLYNQRTGRVPRCAGEAWRNFLKGWKGC